MTIRENAAAGVRICFGAALLDIEHKEQGMEMLDLYGKLGGRIIDTANVYGKWLPSGKDESEAVIGEWLSRRAGPEGGLRRSDLIISTKCGHPDLGSMHTPRVGRAEIFHDIEESLDALRTEWIDICWLHRDAPGVPVAEILGPLLELHAQGKIRSIGVSNWTAGRTMEAVARLGETAEKVFFGTQNRWSCASVNHGGSEDDTLVEMTEEEYRWHCATGYAAMPYSGMAKGYFTKLAKYGKENLSRKMLDYYNNPLNDKRMIALGRLSAETGRPVSQLAAAFLLSQPFPVLPIIGFSTAEQMADAFEAASIRLSAEQMRMIGQGVPW